MDYLRSAASAVLAKSSRPLANYTIGQAVPSHLHSSSTIWQLHQGTKRDDGSPCSIFVYDSTNDPNGRSRINIAKNALRKLRTLRHPDVLKLLDSAETPTAVYIAVEPVRQLQTVLENWTRDGGTQEGKLEWIAWGLSKIANALKFINVDAGAVHGNVRPETIFLSQGGEWRLGGFELLTAKADLEGVIWNMGGLVPDAALYASPEVKQGGWSVLRDLEPHALDSYSFALLAFSAYNGLIPSANVSNPPQGSVPSPLYSLLRRMLVPNAKTRLSVAQLLEAANSDGGIFKENRLAKLSDGFENFMLASERERNEAIKSLQSSSSSLPSDFLSHRILPSLVHALNLSYQPSASQNGASMSNIVHAASVLPLVLQLGSSLSNADWTTSVLPPILKAYASPDRSVRITLLEALPTYIERIDNKRVSDSIWPNVVSGFADSSAAIREGTLKAILPLAPKVTDRIRNNELLRQLAKTQVDVEPSIRTNTTILLGRLAPSLNLATRKSVLIPAFSRSLKDPFVHARVAGLMALMATSEAFDKDDLAKQVLPAVCPALVDKERLVRDQAAKALEMFWARIQEGVKSMPDSVLPPSETPGDADGGMFASNVNGATSFEGGAPKGTGPGGLASTAGGAASALAGWAMSGAMNYFTDTGGAASTSSANPVAASLSSSSNQAAGSMDSKRPTLLTGPSSSNGTSTPPASDVMATPGAISPHRSSATAQHSKWSSPGNLIDMENDTADWTSFESAPARKPIRRGLPGRADSAPSTASASSAAKRQPNLGTKPSVASHVRRELSSTGQERLKMADGAGTADDAAWGDDNDDDDDSWQKSATNAGKRDASSSSNSSAAAIAAFTTPVPGWSSTSRSGTPTSQTQVHAAPVAAAAAAAANTAPDWSNDFAENDEGASKAGSAAATPVSSGAMSKEEKRAQMERQREERRERMRKLKESKGKKLGDSLA